MAGGTGLAPTLLLSLFLLAQAQDDVREPPKILEPPAAAEVFYDSEADVTLLCKARGQPPPVYEWFWNSQPFASTSDSVTFNSATGDLNIKGLTTREEGFYNCRARNTFPNGLSAVAISPKIEVRVARIGQWIKDPDKTMTVNEGSYTAISCGEQLPAYYGPTTFKWYSVEGDDDLREVVQDKRIFIDSEGTLHFTYVQKDDEESNRFYSCAMSSAVQGQITLGGRTRLIVRKTDPIPEVKAVLQFSTKDAGTEALTFERNTVGQLECVFSGYENNLGNEVPRIKWQDNAGNEITSGTGRYTIESEGRVLKIASLVESDEKPYTCIGENKMGSAEGRMTLNVTSSPIWVKPLESTTVPQGQDAVFHCEARSAAGEVPPAPPRWFKNGLRLDQSYDPNKYEFTQDKRVLRVKSVQKDTDIACFQCYVDNGVGEEFSDGCLNVILPIVFITKPQPEQRVEKGDIVNLTVVATSDGLYPVAYKWHFNNVTYEGRDAPPHVTYDVNTQLAYINTSGLTDQQMREIRGLYRREVYHEFERIFVDVDVRLKDDPVVVPVAEAGFDYWIIGLIIGILLIIIILLVICCVICRRKMLEGTYPVDKKETAAGLDPEREVKESEFPHLSRADGDDYPQKKSRSIDFTDIPIGEGDNDSFMSADYGEESTAFNEDGSFIGVYKKPAPPAQQSPATESNV